MDGGVRLREAVPGAPDSGMLVWFCWPENPAVGNPLAPLTGGLPFVASMIPSAA